VNPRVSTSSRYPVERSSRTQGSCPWSSRHATAALPTYPAPPATSTLAMVLFTPNPHRKPSKTQLKYGILQAYGITLQAQSIYQALLGVYPGEHPARDSALGSSPRPCSAC